MNHFIVFDTETTGVAEQDTPVQIAAALVNRQTFQIQAHFTSLINPEREIHPQAQAVHGIRLDMCRARPTLKQLFAATELGDWFANTDVWCGHNVAFDVRMCRSVLPQTPQLLDTLSLARLLFPKWRNHKLTSVVQNLNLPPRQAHDALGDVLSCIDFLQTIADGRTVQELWQLQQTGWQDKRRDVIARMDAFHQII